VGSCQGGTAASSDDNNVCTTDSCDSLKGAVHTPITGGEKQSCGVGACANSADKCLNGSVQTCTPKPAGTEICDGIDNDCDGSADEGFDTDGDGVTTCGGDCNDDFNSIYPDATEKCDGLDNNCDGKTDENYPLKETACSDEGIGQCQIGIYLCSADGASLYCKFNGNKANYTPCDDNSKCTQTDICLAGKCAGSNQVKCSALGQCYDAGTCDSSTGLCSNPTKADATSCDDSNACTAGEACVAGVCQDGTTISSDDNNVCTTDSCDFLKGVAHAPITGGGQITCGTGACQNNVDKCISGVEQTCAAKTGTAEICGDNIDNDCDGITDTKVTDPSGNVYEIGVTTCSKGVGACKGDGVYVCNAVGKPECNAVESEAWGVDICDGKGVDEDCDGLVDMADSDCACIDGQTKACYNGASGTLGVGVCKEGVVTCAKGKWGSTCSSAVTPSAEKCDAVDNDCDGKTDEGFCTISGVCMQASTSNSSNACQVCDPSASQSAWTNRANGFSCDDGNACTTNDKCSSGVCAAGSPVSCVNPTTACYKSPGTCSTADGSCSYELRTDVSGPDPTTEKCDGLDNNCDYKFDEDFPNKGQKCSVGVGECLRYGTYECKSDGSGTVCNAVPDSSSSEICDGKDNDCDGTPDNNFTIPLADKQLGVCADSKKLCLGNKGGLSEPNYTKIAGYEANETLCDGKDNDCDGGIDEDLKNVCGTCGAAPDGDEDGVPDCEDNCPGVGNADQNDIDNNNVGDVCDISCGNGIVEPGMDEGCDAGLAGNSDTMADACRLDCTLARCGDAVKDSGESCDDGNDDDTDLCRNNCSQPTCGDGIVDDVKNEECEAGVTALGEYQYCELCLVKTKKHCGDGNIDRPNDYGASEECEGENLDGKTCELLGHKGGGELSCSSECGFVANCADSLCGDGVKDEGEVCDGTDGVGVHQLCNANCTTTDLPYCGNKIKDEGEECDGSIGCRDDCSLMKCGDWKQDVSIDEQCDLGVANSDSGTCLVSCKNASCGDGVILAGTEECDDGMLNSDTDSNVCRTDCTAARCGDGIIDSGEICDDGKNNDLEGYCSSSCSAQYKYCRDDKRDSPNGQGVFEECDGNDGLGEHQKCSDACRTINLTYCGDGTVQESNEEEVLEECETGVALPEGTPSYVTCDACKLVTGPHCGDGNVNANEPCDDGNDAAGDGCDACQLEECKSSETAVCATGLQGACARGQKACELGSWGECMQLAEANAEICGNGLDDDCDGLTDSLDSDCGECAPGLVASCNIINDVGTCRGTKVCGADYKYGECQGRLAVYETCNGSDDDCDGIIDEDLSRGCSSECGKGFAACANGSWGSCSAPLPKIETCDGSDNDCDGRVDEDVANACGKCGAVPDEICGDLADNNCDGKVDETCETVAAREPAQSLTSPAPDEETETETAPAEELNVKALGTAVEPAGAAASKIFDLKLTRAAYLSFTKINHVEIVGKEESQFVFVGGCVEEKCGVSALSLAKLKNMPEFKLISKDEFVKMAGIGKITKETSGDLINFGKDSLYIVPNIAVQLESAVEIKESKISLPQEGLCYGYAIDDVQIKDINSDSLDDILARLACPEDENKNMWVALKNNPEKAGELEMKVLGSNPLTESEVQETEFAISGQKLKVSKAALAKKVLTAFEIGKEFASGNFELGEVTDIAVGGLNSVRSGTLTVDESGEVLITPYEVKDENYLCESAFDGVYGGKEDVYAAPSNISVINMDNYGGPDLSALCVLVAKEDLAKLKDGEAVTPKIAAMFFYPNANEAPEVNITMNGKDEKGVEDFGSAVKIEGIDDLLYAFGSDPTKDALTYKWSCVDANGADCTALISELPKTEEGISKSPLAPNFSVNAEPSKSVTVGFAYPLTISVEVSDAGNMTAQKSVAVGSVDSAPEALLGPSGASDITVEGSAVSPSSMQGGGGFGCKINPESDELPQNGLNIVLIYVLLLAGMAVKRFWFFRK
jgi:cysteine-rich repeat protein